MLHGMWQSSSRAVCGAVGAAIFCSALTSCDEESTGQEQLASGQTSTVSTNPTSTTSPVAAAGQDVQRSNDDESSPPGGASALEGELEIFLVDVEGGQATVIHFPTDETMLIDTGVAGNRDPARILDVLQNVVEAERLDYMLITHYDGDHVGGAVDVAAGIEVGQFLDHGDDAAPDEYLSLVEGGDRRLIRAGDTLDVGAVHFDFVSAARQIITVPLPGGGVENPHCEDAEIKDGDDENSASIGFVMRFGAFDFLNLADLLWNLEHELVCPANLLGTVDLYLTTHHGLERSGAPQLVYAVEALAAVMNNGPRKGGGGQTWQTLSVVPGAQDVWQLHQALEAPDSENAALDQIANLGGGFQDEANWLRISIDGRGAFTIENPRTQFAKAYQAR
jgi:beta-lactamase superfamily II metal-dependent hydrolase